MELAGRDFLLGLVFVTPSLSQPQYRSGFAPKLWKLFEDLASCLHKETILGEHLGMARETPAPEEVWQRMGAVSQHIWAFFLSTFFSHRSYRELSSSLGCAHLRPCPYCTRSVALPTMSPHIGQGGPGLGGKRSCPVSASFLTSEPNKT